jgi:chemotaxis protein MotA
MDIATIIGLAGAFGAVIMAMGSNVNAFIDVPSMLIVILGAGAATICAFPPYRLVTTFGIVKSAVFVKKISPVAVVTQIIEFAEQARREGILALESRAIEITDDFLKQGIQLAVDGTEPDLIKDILSTEIAYMEARHGEGVKVVDFVAAMGPAFGMCGTVVGLVLMLGNMSDVDSLGPNMAIAMITTLYGSLIANAACLPIVEKLKVYSAREVLIKELMLEGIMSLQSGDNPRIVEQKLTVFLEPAVRVQIMKDKK